MDQRLHISALEVCHNVDKVPKTYKQAMKSHDRAKWQAAMNVEHESLQRHDTYKLVKKPRDATVIRGRWVYSKKIGIDDEVLYKARWVAKGFMQCYGDSYTDTFAPMSRMTSLRCMMSLVAQNNYIAHQLDVTTAYLNADIDHDIYMEQPQGFISGDDNRVCHLLKSLYGLKQSARLWNNTIHDYLTTLGFKRNAADMCLYQRKDSRGSIFLLIWVDDVVIIAENRELVNDFLASMREKFLIKDLGKLRYFLGIEFHIDDNQVTMSQPKYTRAILERFKMQNSFRKSTPMVNNIHHELAFNKHSPKLDTIMTTRYRELVGSLIYLEQCTRPDIAVATNILGQQMANPTKFHWEVGKKVLRYLKHSVDYTIRYQKSDTLSLCAYSDADYANDASDRKSQSGYLTYLSTTSSPISWSSRKQTLLANSTTYAEYIAMSETACELVWIQSLLESLNFDDIKYVPAVLWADSQTALSLTENPKHHRRTKHIDIKYHHLRDLISRGVIDAKFIGTKENRADGFTKPLGPTKFKEFLTHTVATND